LRVDDTVLEKLDNLGSYKLDKLIAIAPAALRRRFGTALNEQLAQILGTKASYLQYIEERHLHQERLPCLEPIRTAKGIEIAIEKLLNLLCKRLQKENLGVRKLQLRGYRIDGKLQQIRVSTSSPTLNQLHLFKLLELKICQIAPVLGIELFIIDALETETLLQQQEPIWHNSTQRIAELAPLLDRIGIRAGKNAIRQYHPQDRHWPEKSIKAVQNMTEPVLASSAKHKRRPCILLNRPELVQVSAPVPDYPPMNFVYQGKIHRIVKADGPERIEQEWWNSEGMHRDYYCVENEKGERYWLFRLGHYNEEVAAKWFVHGFFP
jgi:protein ImuB